jgi:hypothetical protein
VNVVKNLELRINSGAKVADGLIHRFGFEKDIAEDSPDLSNAFDALSNRTLKPDGSPRLPSLQDLEITKLTETSKQELLRYISSPTQILPRYTSLTPENLRYLDARYQRASDTVQVRKTYTPL